MCEGEKCGRGGGGGGVNVRGRMELTTSRDKNNEVT